MPRIRAQPEDFFVEEIPLYPPEDAGDYTLLLIEKRGENTARVGQAIAAAAGVKPRLVGWAGRKDRHAVTRQWFSVAGLPLAQARALEIEGAMVLEARRHSHGLALGDLEGNRFRVTVREVGTVEGETAEGRLEELVHTGLPNRFGRQRYGHDGSNAARGREILTGDTPPRGDRRDMRLFLSALQAEAFDRVIDRRPVDRLLPGDLAWLHATAGVVAIIDPAAHTAAVENLEMSPSGPLFGPKMRRPRDEAGRIEGEVLEEYGVSATTDWRRLRSLRLSGARRPLRIPLRETTLTREADRVELGVVLPPGAYVTVLLDQLFPDGVEEGPKETLP